VSYHSYADLGGSDRTDVVQGESDGAKFHADWEARAMALTLAMGATGLWNIDQSRSMRETLPDYPKLGYYQIWLQALERLVERSGILNRPTPGDVRVLRAPQVAEVLSRGAPTLRHLAGAPRYRVGDAVRADPAARPYHTRLPGYARGKRGVIERCHGAHVFADSHAAGTGESPQWLYTVSFSALELWGADAQAPHSRVSIDAFESYLKPD
jgi:nitrile hydratase